MRKSLLLALSLFTLISCGPMYVTEYELVPPPTNEGRMCANNCLFARTNCEQQCHLTSNMCEQNEHLRAENEYLRYVREREAEGLEIKRGKDSFQNDYRCETDDCMEQCAATYRMCHSNCGGQVIPHTRCEAFCD